MPTRSDLADASLAYRDGRLAIEGVPIEKIAQRTGTPVYVYSADTIRDRFERLRRAFSKKAPLICYALKANSNGGVCRLLAGLGSGAEVVSGGELRRALGCGFSPERTLFSGVGKTQEELALAVREKIKAVNVESTEEFEALRSVARRLKLKASISIRLNPDIHAGGHAHIATGGADTKFGVSQEEAIALYKRASADPWLRPKGLHCHIGSQIVVTEPFKKALKAMLETEGKLRKQGCHLEFLDLGGGIGVPYAPGEKILDPGKLARVLLPELERLPVELILEPGRYLVADAGILITRVLYRKKGANARFLVVDAAMNDLLRPSLYGAHHPILPIRESKKTMEEFDVVGPICESGDFLAKRRRLPPLEGGDLLAVLKTGAYGFSMASQYNSRPRPPEVLVGEAGFSIVRRRELYEDLIRHER